MVPGWALEGVERFSVINLKGVLKVALALPFN